jgi:hypothetical protein
LAQSFAVAVRPSAFVRLGSLGCFDTVLDDSNRTNSGAISRQRSVTCIAASSSSDKTG